MSSVSSVIFARHVPRPPHTPKKTKKTKKENNNLLRCPLPPLYCCIREEQREGRARFGDLRYYGGIFRTDGLTSVIEYKI